MSLPLLLVGCKGKKEQAGTGGPPVITVSGQVIHPRELKNVIQATGSLISNEEVELRSEVPGLIVQINFEEGTHVRKGDLLVKTDDDDLQAQLKKLMLDEKLAKDDVYRKQKLLELKAVSQEEYDKSANQLAIIQAEMDLVNSQIDKTEIYAPFDGMIGLRHVSPGENITSSTLIASLIQNDPVKVDVAIPEKYREKIRKGTIIRFSVEGLDSTFTGTVYAIEPKVDPATRNVLLRARCPNPGGILVPGSFARISILLESIPKARVVPSEAIIPQLNSEKVYVCRGGKARSQIIATGLRTEREVQVVDGLRPGDTVITTGILQLREGMDVRVRIPQEK